MIRLEAVNKSYQTRQGEIPALTDINLHIKKGSVFGIIGRSGAGKSTLIRLLNLLERPSSGRIVFQGQDISRLQGKSLRLMRQKMGMVFQHFNLLESRTVLDNVCLPLRIAGVGRAERRAKAQELLELVGLQDHVHKYPAQLSGGQKQRVGIARSLANSPDVLLCDEATSALDPETTKSILDLLSGINARLGITIVLITHSMSVIRNICDEVAVIDKGRIAESGAVIDVFLHPREEITMSLLTESGPLDEDAWKAFFRSSDQKVVRLSYRGQNTQKPLISEVSREMNASISILKGTVSQLKDTAYGQLVVAIDAATEDYQKIAQKFADNGVDYEEIEL